MIAKLMKIVLSIVAGTLGLVLVMAMLSGAGPAAALEDAGNDATVSAAGSPNDVLVGAYPEEIRADGYSHSTVTGTVRDAGCGPVPGAFMAFTTTLGTIDQYCYVEAESASVNKSPGDWTIEGYAGASGGQYAKTCGTAHPNASLNWTFAATAISMLYVKSSDGGVAEIRVDGSTAMTIDMYAGTQTAAERVITAGLSSGPHVITVTYLTQSPVGLGTCIRIDAFRCGITTDSNGNGTATLTSTVLSCGSEYATAMALAGAPSIPYMITGTKLVKMTASVPNTVAVTANPNQIIANGTSTSILEATVRDQFGVLVPDCTMVSFVATDEDSAPPGGAWVTLPYELVEGEDPTEVITNGWSITSNVSHHGGKAIYTNTTGATASWNFTGTAVSLMYAKLSDAGVASVTVDSGLPITIDMYAPSPGQYQVEHVITHALKSGPHVITVTVAGYTVTGGTDKRVYVDALRSGVSTSGGKATAVLTSGTQAGVVMVEATGVGRPCCETDSVVVDTVLITLTAGNPYTLTITPTDLNTTCCATSTLQFTVTDQYSNVVGAVVPRTLTVDFTSKPYGIFTPTSVVITNGLGSVIFHGWVSGTGAITGTVRGYGVTDTSKLTVTAASCYTLTINANPTRIYVTDTNTSLLTNFRYTSTITAEMKDKCGSAVQNGTVVTFTTSLGNLSPANTTTVNGFATAVLTSVNLPAGVPTSTAYITVTGASCPVSNTTSVTFGRHVYTLTVTANPDKIRVGGNTSTLTADVDDGFGDPTPNGVMVGFTITPTIRASVPYEFVQAEDGTEVTRPGWSVGTTGGVTYIYANTVGAWASWNFTGTAVSFVYHQDPSRGTVTVTINSPLYTRVIDMSGPDAWVERVITTGLSFASRNVTVTVRTAPGGINTELDAFRSGATIGGGAGQATATATSGTEAGVAVIEAAAVGSTVTNTGLITITAGDPYTLTITPTDVSITCCVTSTLQFTVTDRYGNRVGAVVPQPVTVCLDCHPSSLVDSWSPTGCVAITTGVGSVEFHGYKAGTGSIEGYVAGFAAQARDTSNLTVSVSSPAGLNVTRAPATILADGFATSIITATVKDSCENPLCSRIVTFTTDFGSFEPPPTTTLSITKTTNCNGIATATLRSGCSSRRVNITVTADSLTGTTYVDMVGVAWDVQLVANPTSIPVGGYTSNLTATVNDQFGHSVVDGTVVTFTTSLGSVGSTTIIKTTTTGIARAVLTSSNTTGTATISATAGSGADKATGTVTVTFRAGPPYTVTLVAYPMTLTVGNTSSLTATVTDQYNNKVANGTVVTFATSLGDVGSNWVTKTTTSGVATAILTSQVAGTASVTATADSKYATTKVTFQPGLPYTLTLTAYPMILTVGNNSTLTATVKDQYNNSVANGTLVTFTTSLGTLGSTTVSKATTGGIATATLTSQLPGTAAITATAGSISDTETVVFNVGLPYTVTLVAYPTSIPIAGYTSTLTATVKDKYNNIVSNGTLVTFTTSLGEVGSTQVTKTTSSGVATAILTSGNTAGTAIVTATSDSRVATTTVQFMPLLPYTVTLVAYPINLTVGQTSTLTATVTDQYNNNVANGTVVTFATTLGSLGSVTITKGTANGVATATLTSQVPGTATVTATADSVSDTVDVTFNPGPPYTVTLKANPTSILVGGFTSTLTITVTDQFNNHVANGTLITFATSLGSLGAVTKTTASGVATATLTSGNISGVAVVTATTDSKVVTTTVTFTPDVPYTITLVAYPITLTVGNTSTLTATVKDRYNNNVADGTSVLFETSLGSLGSITVTKPTTNGIAVATLTSQLPGIAAITATADSKVATTTVEFKPGPPYTVTLVAYPVTLTVGNTSSLTATVKDQYNNNVANGTVVTFTTNLGDVGSKLVTKVTISGVATATLTSQVAGTASVTATADSKYATVNVTFNPGSPNTVTVAAYPTIIPIGGATSGITATVKDLYGNMVANGTEVTFTTDLGSVGSNSVVKTTVNGVANTTLTSGLVIGTAHITVTSDSAVGYTQVTFTVGPPYTVTVESWPPTIEVGGNTATITATVRDIGGYAVANGTAVVFTTDFGSLGSNTVTKYTTNGIAVATLTSGLTPGVAHITVTAGSKFDTAIVKFAAGPPFTIGVMAHPTYIPIGGATSRITVTVKDRHGNNVTNGTNVDFFTTLGNVSPSSDATMDGMAATTLTSGIIVGTARVNAISGPAEGWVDVVFTVGPPFYINVVADPTSIALNGQTSNIEATVKDIGGNNVADETLVLFTTSLGTLGSNTITRTTASGVATAVLSSGTIAGTAIITGTADSVYDIAEVIFNPGPPYTVTLKAVPPAIPANGVSTSMIRANVTDQYGNTVADETGCSFQTTLGSVWPPYDTTLNGVAETILTSIASPGLATVTAMCGGKQDTTHVVFYTPFYKLYLPVVFKAY